jgi:hypothetical protein
MKLAPAVLLVLWFAPADPAAELAAKQKAAMYDPAAAGLTASVVAFYAEGFGDERLVIEEPGTKLAPEGVAAGQEEARRAAMNVEWLKARDYAAPLRFLLADLRGEYEVQVIGNGVGFMAHPRERSGDAPGMIVGQVDARGLLTRLEEMQEGRRQRTCTDFTWQAVGDKWVATGYRTVQGRADVVITAEYEEISGFTLLRAIRVKTGDEPAKLYAFDHRSINGKPAQRRAEGPFATPEATVKTFLAAAAAKDPGMLAKCFAENAEEEFAAIREQKLAAKDLEEIAAMFGAGRVLSAATAGDGKSATVRIAMRRGGEESEEEISLAPDEHGEWKIVGF